MSTIVSSPNRAAGITGSLLFHITLVAIVLLFIRGCGGGGEGTQYVGLSIASLGEFEQGLGEPTDQMAAESQPQPQESDPSEEQVETVDDSPVTAPKATDNPKKDPVKNPNPPKEQPKEQPKQPSDQLNNALNQLGKPGGSSSGETKPGGNEGAPDGQIGGKGVFSGSGGNGEWSLAGRSMAKKPSLDERPTEEGKVVVDIWVDKSGKVVKAVANASRSNTTSAQLFKLAEKAALSAQFNAIASGGQVKGTITIIFKLK